MIDLGRKKKQVTTDDVREALGIPAEATYVPNIPGPLARARIFRKVGVTESSRKERRGGDVRIWEYTGNEEATNKWLIENPLLVAVVPGNPVARPETPVAEQSTSTTLDQERERTPSVNGPTEQKPMVDPSTSPPSNDAVSEVKPEFNDSTNQKPNLQQRLFDQWETSDVN